MSRDHATALARALPAAAIAGGLLAPAAGAALVRLCVLAVARPFHQPPGDLYGCRVCGWTHWTDGEAPPECWGSPDAPHAQVRMEAVL